MTASMRFTSGRPKKNSIFKVSLWRLHYVCGQEEGISH